MKRSIIDQLRGTRLSEISRLSSNAEEDEIYLKSLGIHPTNVYYFLKGSYEERAQYIAGPRRMIGFSIIFFLTLVGGTIVSLIYALDGWIYGYIFFGLGIFLSLIMLFSRYISSKKRREDPLLKKAKECMNHAILKSTEFLLEEFSKSRIERDLGEEFIFFAF